MSRRLILASTSAYRRELLGRLGVPFDCERPAVDEDLWKARITDPLKLATCLACAKAEAVAAEHEDAIVLGSDQVAELDGVLLGKPGTAERAVEQLRSMAGRTHRLITAIAVCVPGRRAPLTHVDVMQLTMRALTDAELVAYVEHDEPLDCAGSYKIERLGITLFDRIEGGDFTSITGLGLMGTTRLLTEAGVPVLGQSARRLTAKSNPHAHPGRAHHAEVETRST